MSSSSDDEKTFHDSRTRSKNDDSFVTEDESESNSNDSTDNSKDTESSDNVSSDVESDSSNDSLPVAFLKKHKKRNMVISDDESDDDNELNGSASQTNISKTSTQNASKNSNSTFDDGNELSGSVNRMNLSKISTQNDSSSLVESSSVVGMSCENSNASESQVASTSNDSNRSNSIVADKSRHKSNSSLKKENPDTSISRNKSFTKYRAKTNLISSDDDESDDSNVNRSKMNRSSGFAAKEIRKSHSSVSQTKLFLSDSELASNDSNDEEKFEVEFQRNVFSPRTRMSITGVGNTSDLSNSDSEIADNESEVEKMQPIIIPDSDNENGEDTQTNDETLNSFRDLKPLNTIGIKMPLQTSSPKPTIQPKSAKIFVSQEFYDKQVMKLKDMENELQKSVQLRGAFQIKLPDDGRRLSGRIDRLKLDIEQHKEYIQTLAIQTTFSQNEIKPNQKPAPTKIVELSWEALNAVTNEVKPKYTGQTGLKTFNTQKVMTLDTLKEIHESISSCPTFDTYADDPQGLKIELMPHQKYALAWLEWRETQRPRGGILADDMGLGKTLSIIAHVLAANYRKENCSADEESDEKENPHDGWIAKGRKDLYNGGTLVICPASLIGQWESEIKNRVKRGLLTYVVHHGTKRDVKARHLAKNDIVITTYNIVSRECGPNSMGPLANIKWDRVVLDEAHVIRNHKSRMSESVSALNRRNNWILTGTPIQNKEMDMFALLRFLKCRPFDDIGHFKKWIDNKNAGGQLRMNTILKAILLRRTKAELIATGGILNMPSKTVQIVEVTLEKDEMNVYQKIMLYSQTLFAQYLHQRAERDSDRTDYDHKKTGANSAYHKAHKMLVQMHAGERDVKSHEILVLLLRLRQICCHPGLITAMLEDEDKSAVLDDSTSEHDSIDIDLMEQLNNLNLNSSDPNSFELPTDGSRVTKASQKVLLKSNPVYDFARPSSKFLKVMDVLKEQVIPKNENAVIVSQWTHVLEVIGMTLRRNGIAYSSLTGSVPVKDRGAIVEHFNKTSQNTKILLLSLTAGGVGLNLVGGNHLLLVDLHWNPQLEAQAQDRIYRVGQTKPVSIYKFVCTNTIEQRIKGLQDKKLEIANGVLTGSSTKGSKLSIDDLKSLFDI